METAAKVLITGGVLNFAYAVLTGLALTNIRSRAPEAPRHLTLAHIGPFMQGAMLIGLAVALGLSSLAESVETLAAWLLVGGSAAIAAGDTLNWLGKAGDAFAERPPGFYFLAGGGMLTGTGIAIMLIGVLRGL
jgi:hypothetical protein